MFFCFLEILFEELHTNIPVFYVQPNTKNNFSPQFSSYACKAYGSRDIEYRWNKIDIVSKEILILLLNVCICREVADLNR